MAINKVQFQKGLSVAEFMERYGTEEKCHAALVASRWPTGFVCPSCAGSRHCTFVRKGLQYWQCSSCREQITATCGTILQATKLPLTRWFLGMYLLTQAKNNLSALELKRHLGVRYKTAWLMKHKLLQVMVEREDSRQLDGRVEIDDAYLGGEASGGTGLGEQGAVHCRCADHRVRSTHDGVPEEAAIHQESHRPMGQALAVCLCPGGLRWAVVLPERYRRRGQPPATVTGGGAASVKPAQFRAVNTLLGNLKTAFSGPYHSFDFTKYGHRYLAEFQYRFNRRFDLSVILLRLLRASSVTSLHPERLIRVAELHG